MREGGGSEGGGRERGGREGGGREGGGRWMSFMSIKDLKTPLIIFAILNILKT